MYLIYANNVVFYVVTRCRFSQHGNKFGIADGDGKLSLWQVGLASQSNRSFFVSFIALIMFPNDANKVPILYSQMNVTINLYRTLCSWVRAV